MRPTAALAWPTPGKPAEAATGTAGSTVPAPEFLGRRPSAQLLVAADGSAATTRQLVWALQEAARREAIVLAVALLDADATEEDCATTRTLLDAQLLHAVAQTGVHGRARTALLDPAVFEALTGAADGGDLVLVRPHRKTVLRPAVPRPPLRRPLVRCA